MADAPAVQNGENSPEYVAWKLMFEVLRHENPKSMTRQLVLDTYAECLQAVTHPHLRLGTYKTSGQ
jgi:hypothetical protein